MRRAIPASLMLAFAAALHAQRAPAEEMIPRSVAEDLARLSSFGSGSDTDSATILMGRLPPDLADRLTLPRGSRVIAGLASGSNELAIIAGTMSVDSLLAHFRREMPRRGWTGLGTTEPAWGFSDARSRPAVLALCGHQRLIAFIPNVRRTAESQIFVSASRLSGGSCDNVFVSSRGQSWARPGTMPGLQLVHPTAVDIVPNAGRGNGPCDGSSYENAAQDWLTTRLTADELFAHYGKQLADSGWMPAPTRSVTQTWTRVDSGGKARSLDLRISTIPGMPMCRSLWLEMSAARR